MKIATALSSASFGNLGTFWVWDDQANTESIPLPETVNTLIDQPDFPSWRRGNFSRTYVLGGHTTNLVFTEHKWLLRMSINAPSAPIVPPVAIENQVSVVASGAAGLTGSCSFALRWLDTLHHRRSPLSAASAAIALVSQGVTFANVPNGPVPADPCVDAVEIYVSVDGGLYRHWATRDIGASTFTVNETTTGEAYTDELTPFPKLGFGDMANDCLFAAGDPRHPERVYVSVVGQPEEYGGLYIPTRNGERVIGLKNIGGSTIYVQCPNSSYYIQGFGAGDLVMRVLKPRIGGFGQRSIVHVDDVALIPTQRGWYRCDGTSMVPIGVGDWDETWRKCVAGSNRTLYEGGFSVIDYVSGVVKYIAPSPTDESSAAPDIIGFPRSGQVIGPTTLNSVNNYWVINMAGLIPDIGGPGMADLTFDLVNGYKHTCAQMLYDPDASVGALYTGTSGGDIMLENQDGKVDRSNDGIGGDVLIPKTFLLHTSHERIGPVADREDSFQTTDIWANYQCENLESTIGVYAGNEFAWQAATPNTANLAPTEVYTIPMGREFPPVSSGMVNPFVARDKYKIPSLAKSPGSCVSLRLTVVQSADDPGSFLAPLEQRSEVVFTGWGYVAEPGTERRPIAPGNPE